MNSNYIVNVDNTFSFEINQNDLSNLDLIKTSKSIKHLLHEQKSYSVEFTEEDFQNKKYKIKLNNTSYSVEINDALDVLIKDLGFEIGNSKLVDEIHAPMPGLILEISVEVGNTVKENDPLLILEAMKMENVISSPRDGVIKSIAVSKGQAVDKSQILIAYE